MQQAAAIVRQFDPEYAGKSLADERGCEIYATDPDTVPAGKIMQALASAGLIEAFYTFGQTADYALLNHREYIMVYPPEITQKDAEPQQVDWTAVEAWVQAQHPECSFVCVKPEDTELVKKLGLYHDKTLAATFTGCLYAVIPPDTAAFAEQFAVAAELYEQFGLPADYFAGVTALMPAFGQNALTISGDATVDGAVDVADAVLIARYIAGVRNADADGSGKISTEDVTAVLQIVAKKK